MSARLRLLSVVLPCLLAAAPRAQGCASGPPLTLGTMTPFALGLPAATKLPNSHVDVFVVDCQGLPSIGVQVQISEPPATAPFRGTIVLGAGARGTSFYSAETNGFPLALRLHQLGFRVVDRAWVTGWFDDALGMRKQSCRYATVLDWVARNVHTQGALGALGQSSASSEIAYALSTWGQGQNLDFAVLIGGPNFSRLDLSCQRPPSAAWVQQCAALTPPNVVTCQPYSCELLTGFNICNQCGPSPSAFALREDSVLHTSATVDYPNTRVHMLVGGNDCWGTIPAVMLFFQAGTSERIVEFVPGANHFVVSFPQGLDAATRAVLGAAAARPGPPAAMAYTAWPRIGGLAGYALHGPPGATAAVLGSTTAAIQEVPQLGWAFLGSPFLLGTAQLDAQGRGRFDTPVPPIPAFTGFEVYSQALLGSRLSNLVRFELLP